MKTGLFPRECMNWKVHLDCKLLWIGMSAKCINANVYYTIFLKAVGD